MKKYISFIFIFLLVASVQAATQYSSDAYGIVSGSRQGENGYISVLRDIESFSITTDFGSIGNSGAVGFYVYSDDIANAVDGGSLFRKGNSDGIDLGSLSAGDKIGFYLVRNNGDIITDFYFAQDGDSISLQFVKNGGNGKDEMFAFGQVNVVASGGSDPSGQPLPGILAALIAGGAVHMVRRRRCNPAA